MVQSTSVYILLARAWSHDHPELQGRLGNVVSGWAAMCNVHTLRGLVTKSKTRCMDSGREVVVSANQGSLFEIQARPGSLG